MSNVLVILGSSRSNGDARRTAESVIGTCQAEWIDLLKRNVSYYDYESRNQDDDFLPIAGRMAQAGVIVFVTPVYWYSMSAVMKTFFDRFTDLITVRKDLGRALAGKKCYLIACGSDKMPPPGFEEPFRATCEYLDMLYQGCFYARLGKNAPADGVLAASAAEFGKRIFK